MTTADVKRLGLILAVQAEIDGMKAGNEYRRIFDDYPAYDQYNFDQMAEQIREIVNKHDDQL